MKSSLMFKDLFKPYYHLSTTNPKIVQIWSQLFTNIKKNNSGQGLMSIQFPFLLHFNNILLLVSFSPSGLLFFSKTNLNPFIFLCQRIGRFRVVREVAEQSHSNQTQTLILINQTRLLIGLKPQSSKNSAGASTEFLGYTMQSHKTVGPTIQPTSKSPS